MRYLITILISLFCSSWNFHTSAQKGHELKFEESNARTSFSPGIKVIRGETKVIIPQFKTGCPTGTIFRFNNGIIQVGDRRSSDNGKNWIKVEKNIMPSMYQFPEPDGEVLALSWATKKSNEKGVYEASIFRSSDNGITFSEETTKIFLPEELSAWSGVIDRKIVSLKDGSLIASTYGRTPGIEGYLVFNIRSVDRGKTWYFLSKVAFNLTTDLFDEGYCEPCLVVNPENNKIFCFIRTGGDYAYSLGSTYAAPSPKQNNSLYMSVSNDGESWSTAYPVSPNGVWPDALFLENGIMVVGYGRPGNWLMFSKDEGSTWGPRIQFYNDIYPPDCGNYLSILEISPNIILVVYARTDQNDNTLSEIVGTYFKIELQ